MIITLIIWVYVFFLSFFYGYAFINFLNKKIFKKDYFNFPISCFTGIVLITITAQFYSLFDKVGLLLNCFLLAGAVFSLVFIKKKKLLEKLKEFFNNYNLFDWSLLLAVLIFLIYKSSITIKHYDTYLYLASAVRWIEEFGIVEGLGNLHGRLAFNSSWLLSQGLFGFSFLFKNPIHSLNQWLIFLTFFYVYNSTKISNNSKNYKNIFLKILIIIFFIKSDIWGFVPSLATDIPTVLFLCLIFLLFIEYSEQKNGSANYIFPILISSFSFFVFTVKLSSIPVLIFPMYFIVREFFRKNWKTFFLIIGMFLIIITPFLIRNIILSGYIIYPFPHIDIFNFEWKIPFENAINENKWVKSWAIYPRMHCDVVLNMSFNEWFSNWYLKQRPFNLFLFNSIVYLSILNLFKIILDFRANKANIKIFILYLTLYCGVLFWFFQAPSFRFGYGFIIVLASLSITNALIFVVEMYEKLSINKIFSYLSKRIRKKFILFYSLLMIYSLLVVCIINLSTIIIFIAIFNTKIFIANTKKYYLYPAPYKEFPVKKTKMNNFYVFIPESKKEDRTGYSRLPSTTMIKRKEKVKLRGIYLKQGFKID